MAKAKSKAPAKTTSKSKAKTSKAPEKPATKRRAVIEGFEPGDGNQLILYVRWFEGNKTETLSLHFDDELEQPDMLINTIGEIRDDCEAAFNEDEQSDEE